MGTFAPRLAIAAVAALALTACSEPTPTPAPPSSQATTTEEPSTPTKKTTTSPKSDRPADKDLSAVMPCDVAKALKPADFGIDQVVDGLPDDSSGAFPGSKSCTVRGDKANLILGIVAVVSEGFASYTGSVVGDVEQVKIEGYPAAIVKGRPNGGVCSAVVDTKDGQMMHFQLMVANSGAQPVTPHAELCAKVPKIAEAGMKAVLAG